MSARTPFFPTNSTTFTPESRPASRLAREQDKDASSGNLQLALSPSNPLHASLNSMTSTLSEARTDDISLANKDLHTRISNDKAPPLKFSGLLGRKSQPHRSDNQMAPRRSSVTEKSVFRPGTADPAKMRNEQRFGLIRDGSYPPKGIQAPSPIPAAFLMSTSGIFSSSAFKTPALPSSLSLTSQISAANASEHVSVAISQTSQEQGETDDVHISTSLGEFKLSKPFDGADQHSPEHSSSSTLTDTDAEHQAPDRFPVAFKLDMSLPNQTGPRRVPIETPCGKQDANAQRQKRGRNEEDEMEDEDSDVSIPVKRYKSYKGEEFHHRGHKHFETSAERHRIISNSSQYSVPRYEHSPSPPSNLNHQQRQQAEQFEHDSLHDARATINAVELTTPGALNAILGLSADEYIADHNDAYERSTKRWKECSFEEWVAGADEITAKYAHILDFVKLHMTTKMKLFTSFDNQIDKHNIVLEERAKVLAGARERLIREGGNVLGAGVNMGTTGE